jgi:hypothetical protein
VVSQEQSSNGYTLAGAICNQAAYHDNYPGTVQVGVWWSPPT